LHPLLRSEPLRSQHDKAGAEGGDAFSHGYYDT
jgi:hypothetical protein